MQNQVLITSEVDHQKEEATKLATNSQNEG